MNVQNEEQGLWQGVEVDILQGRLIKLTYNGIDVVLYWQYNSFGCQKMGA